MLLNIVIVTLKFDDVVTKATLTYPAFEGLKKSGTLI